MGQSQSTSTSSSRRRRARSTPVSLPSSSKQGQVIPKVSLPTSMPFELPEDIWHSIARQLKDEVASLRALALISRSFTPVAQRQLFHLINLPGKLNPQTYNHTNPPEPLTKLISILSKNPTLATYIHDLHLLQIAHSPPDQPMMSFGILWIQHHPGTLVNLLKLLEPSPIESCTLLFQEPGSMDWSHLNQALRTQLLEVFRKPTLRQLRVEGISIPHKLFLHCGGLQSLALISASATPNPLDIDISEPLPLSAHPHKVQRFYYSPRSSDAKPFDFIGHNGSIDFSELKFLYLGFTYVDRITPVANLLRIRSITELHLRPAIHWITPPPIDFSALVYLKKLTVALDSAIYVKPQLITWIESMLSSLPTSQPTFHTFHLKVAAHTPKDFNLSLYKPLSASFSDAHKRLQGILKEVLFLVKFSNSRVQGVDIDEFVGSLTGTLAWEGCEGILEVNTVVVPWTMPSRITGKCAPICS